MPECIELLNITWRLNMNVLLWVEKNTHRITMFNIRIELLLMLIFLSLTICSASFFGRVHVKISNELGQGLVLNLHCYSSDDDLGTHALPIHGSIQFSFRPSVFKTTIFTCSFGWNGGYHVAQIYNHDRDRCRNCTWSIIPSGPCQYNFDLHQSYCYLWPKERWMCSLLFI